MAERVGFEPTLEFPLNTLSKRAPSATRPSLREFQAGLRLYVAGGWPATAQRLWLWLAKAVRRTARYRHRRVLREPVRHRCAVETAGMLSSPLAAEE